MEKLSLAICGFGRFATHRIIPAISMCKNVELVAVVGGSMKNCHLGSNVQWYKSLEDYLGTCPTGAVYISTPNYLHAQQTLLCLEAGLHVLCEKPMATNSADCRTMVKVARNMKRYLKVGHMLRYSPALQLAQSWLQEGMIGKPQAIRALFHYDLPEENRPWAFRQDFAGGGALLDAGIHCIDSIRFLVGDPVVLIRAITDKTLTSGVEQSAACKFTVAGVSGHIQVCSQAPYRSRLSVTGISSEIVIDNFAACWEKISVKLYSFHPEHGRHVVKEEMVDVSTIYSEQIRDFADVVKRSEVSCSAGLDAAENVRIVEELYAISHCQRTS